MEIGSTRYESITMWRTGATLPCSLSISVHVDTKDGNEEVFADIFFISETNEWVRIFDGPVSEIPKLFGEKKETIL